MNRKEDINALLKTTKQQLSQIEERYNTSLHKKEIDSELKITIKNYLENLKSTLDYLAQDISEIILGRSSNEVVYFPIVGKDKNVESFKGAVNRNLPKLEEINKDIFDYIESIQSYHKGCEWLADFANLTNDHKHQKLIAQIRKETQRIKVENVVSGGSVSWDPSAVRFGSGVYINGAPVNPATQMPIPTPHNKITKEIWVDFIFENINKSALAFLKQVNSNVEKIINDIFNFMK